MRLALLGVAVVAALSFVVAWFILVVKPRETIGGEGMTEGLAPGRRSISKSFIKNYLGTFTDNELFDSFVSAKFDC